MGFVANLAGLALFHDHGHSHGENEHTHNTGDDLSTAEEGQHPVIKDRETRLVADESGNILDALPESVIGSWGKPKNSTQSQNAAAGSERRHSEVGAKKGDDDSSTAVESESQYSSRNPVSIGSPRGHRHRASTSHSKHANIPDLHIHPASFRNEIISSANRLDEQDSPISESAGDNFLETEPNTPTEHSPLLSQKHKSDNGTLSNGNTGRKDSHDIAHAGHKHRQPKSGPEASGHGHSHGDLNMQALFLHVLGDALGNLGVIATALFIWLTPFWWRFYCDPMISLVITVIILCSALPLCRATASILLQAVPKHISVADIKEDIEQLSGVVSCHHLHVWQLSDTKLVASLHVQVAFPFEGDVSKDYKRGGSKKKYMRLAKAIRTCLHEYGIHSSTIQPEFCLDTDHNHTKEPSLSGETNGHNNQDGASSSKQASKQASRQPSLNSVPDGCLLDCDDNCDGGGCCAPTPKKHDGHAH